MNIKKVFFLLFIFFLTIHIITIFHQRPYEIRVPDSISSLQNDEESTQRLLTYMVKSRYWRVHPFPNRTEYVMRTESFCATNKTDHHSLSASIVVPKSNDYLSQRIEPIQRTDGTNSVLRVKLKGEIGKLHSRLMSTLNIELAPTVYLRLHENGYSRNRTETLHFLHYLETVLANLRDGNENALLESEESIRKSTHSTDYISIDTTTPGGQSKSISGWTNPKQKGEIEILFIDPQTNKILNQAKRFRTRESVGWSTNPSNLFFFSSPLFVDGDGDRHDMIISILFTPESGNQRILFSTNICFETWRR